MTDAPPRTRWEAVCHLGRLTPDRGAAALVGGEQVAIFLLADGTAFAIDDRDPFTGSYVLSRGLIGDADGTPTVASPIYKQRFDLRTGRCLDDASVSVRTWSIRVQDGWVEVLVQ
jgi:nitrite reductase (NADH) small subunit